MTELSEAEKALVRSNKPGGQSSPWAMAPLYAAVAAIIDARLAPIRALAEDWAFSDGDTPPVPSRALADLLTALLTALNATGADLSASQDHDGTEGQGEGEEAGEGDLDGFEYTLTNRALRQIKAEAWDEGCDVGYDLALGRFRDADNPYREDNLR